MHCFMCSVLIFLRYEPYVHFVLKYGRDGMMDMSLIFLVCVSLIIFEQMNGMSK